MWFRKKPKIQEENSQYVIPKHIAFIADGNGRWANKRGLPRFEGHKVGRKAIELVANRCFERGVNIVSFYCLSTENLNRPKEEVDYIFGLIRSIDSYVDRLKENDCRFMVSGDLSLLPEDVRDKLQYYQEQTKECKTKIVNMCIAYGSRHEIMNAVNKLLSESKNQVSEEEFKNYLYTAGLPDPDLIVRASGEQRLSNFLLFQAAYSEFYFPKTHWPDFNEKVVDECLLEFGKRQRRFGKI